VSATSDLRTDPTADTERSRLVATHLRQYAGHRSEHSIGVRLPWYAIERAIADDLRHLHLAHDLREVQITSQRPVVGALLVRMKRRLQRLLHPLPESQSVWNGASARVVSALLRQISVQARTIEQLERRISALERKPRP
jgi:hypothetical protein